MHFDALTDGLYSLLITFLRIALPCSPHIDDASVQMEGLGPRVPPL